MRQAGSEQHKPDGNRTEHWTRRRQHDFEHRITRSVTPERAQDVSNRPDGDIAGPDHKHDSDGRRKRKPPVSEPRRRA